MLSTVNNNTIENYFNLLEEFIDEANAHLTINPRVHYTFKAKNVLGAYNKTLDLITIDINETTNIPDFIDTYLHEARHAYQHKYNLDVEYSYYNKDSYDDYFNCSAEQDARHYSETHKSLYSDKYMRKYIESFGQCDFIKLVIAIQIYFGAEYHHNETGELMDEQWVLTNAHKLDAIYHHGYGDYTVDTNSKYMRKGE